MAKLDFHYDFDYAAATGQPWRDVVISILEEAAQQSRSELIAMAPRASGTLALSHIVMELGEVVHLRNIAPYANYVIPVGSKGNWRWWMYASLRNSFEDVSLRRYGDVEDAVLATIGPIPSAASSRGQARTARRERRMAAAGRPAAKSASRKPAKSRRAR